MLDLLRKYSLYLTFATALCAMLGSLYASEILHLEPCVLCWYQRILMYPLVVISAVGILRKERAMHHYVLPFSITGSVIAFYHYLLYLGIISEELAPCVAGVSCTQQLPGIFGFINVILLSLVAFTSITVLMFIYRTSNENK